jgi:predicted extracellular nuclease
MPVPNPGDIIFNEYASDNDANGNDFVELLTVADNLDLRGLRISDNELVGGVLNNNESVLVFGNDTFLNNVPKGTAIAIWTIATGVTTDTTTNPASNDWKMVLAPGTGITASIDGLGGSVNTGLSTGGEALYLYSPGADGNSGGTDNAYLDFLSFEADAGDAPTGLTDLNLASVADNAYYTGNTATGKNTASNWVRYDFPSTNPTPGDANPSQDLSGLRSVVAAGIAIAQSGGSTNITEGGATDSYTLVLNSQPTADVTVTISPDSQTTINPTTLTFTSANWNQPQTVTVTAVDDTTFEGNHSSSITHAVSSLDTNYNGIAIAAVNASITDNDTAPVTRIRQIQGLAHLSPLVGQTVNNVQGVVTAVAARGFYLQDPNTDTNNATSEGIFVFTSSAPTVTVGQSVGVTGRVDEFRPGNNAGNLTTTQINASVSGAVVTPLASSLGTITPIIIGTGGRIPPNAVIQNDFTTTNRGNVETGGDFDPTTEGIDFYESLEGMLVQINNPVVTSPTNSFGEIWVLPDNGANATGRTARGGSLISATDFNPERIQIDDTLFTSGTTSPLVNVGATLNTISGVVDYNFNNYEVLPTSLTVNSPGSLTKETTNLAGDSNNLTVATFNVENLDPSDGDTQFNNIANRIVNNLKAPDIISLEEIQDNNGATNDTVVDANQTYQKLIDAIKTAGGPTYQYRQINPVDDQDGGEPGGNIRVGFLFNPTRVSFVDRAGGGSTINTTITNNSGKPELSASPGRIDPTNSAFNSSRKPLVGEFLFKGETVFAIANHFNSKGGDQALFGPNQPPTLSSEAQRLQQAQIVNDFVDNIFAADANANVIVLGDLNDFEFSEPLNVIKGIPGGTGTPILNNLLDTIPANERYTYNFQGNAQVLDHILVSKNLSNKLNGYDIVHINSEFADQDSDHDPSVA